MKILRGAFLFSVSILQKYVHAMQMNLQFIVMLVEGYTHVVISSKKVMCEWKKNNRDTIENRNICLPIYEQNLYRPILNTTECTTQLK